MTGWPLRGYERTFQSHTACVFLRAGAACLLLTLPGMSGCADDSDAPETGVVLVTVTLSRSGPPADALDHVPLDDIQVTVSNASGDQWEGETDSTGEERLSVPAGEYEVGIGYCPDAPKPVTVKVGQTTSTRFDCMAP
jgi:hypothetical protein